MNSSENKTVSDLWVYNVSYDDSLLTLNLSGMRGCRPLDVFDPDLQVFRRIVLNLDLYFVPVVAIIGILGNALSFLVFMCTYLSRMSSSVYLAALSVSDAIFLSTVLMSWLTNLNIQLQHTPGCCQLLSYVAYVSSFLSVWYIVGFTVERYVAIRFPLRRQTMCTAKRAQIVVISMATAAAVGYTFALWTSGVTAKMHDRPFCTVLPKYLNIVGAINNVDTFATLIIPTVLIIGSNARIAYGLAQFYNSQKRMEMDMTRTFGTRYSHSRGLFSDSSYNRLQMKVTRMLLIVSTVFLICNIPSHAIRVYVYIASHTSNTYCPSYAFILVQKVFFFVHYINFAVNFILYNMTGKSYRRALARLCRCVKQRVHNYFLRLSSQSYVVRPRTAKTRLTPNELIVRLRGTVENYN